MAGNHAPASPWSFYLSLGRAVAGALAAVGLIVALTLVATGRGTPATRGPGAATSPSPTPTPTATPGAATTPAPEVTPTVLPADRVTVAVLNGTSRSRLAARTAARVRAAGYAVTTVGNAARIAKSTIFYRADSRAEAEAFQRSFPQFTVLKEAPSGLATNAILTAVIGADFP